MMRISLYQMVAGERQATTISSKTFDAENTATGDMIAHVPEDAPAIDARLNRLPEPPSLSDGGTYARKA